MIIMKKYEQVKKFIDSQSLIADDYKNIDDYNLVIRISQMYNELKQIKLSYERVLKTEKGELIRAMIQARQSLYNASGSQSTKQELRNGIDYAIQDLNKILVLEEVEDEKEN